MRLPLFIPTKILTAQKQKIKSYQLYKGLTGIIAIFYRIIIYRTHPTIHYDIRKSNARSRLLLNFSNASDVGDIPKPKSRSSDKGIKCSMIWKGKGMRSVNVQLCLPQSSYLLIIIS